MHALVPASAQATALLAAVAAASSANFFLYISLYVSILAIVHLHIYGHAKYKAHLSSMLSGFCSHAQCDSILFLPIVTASKAEPNLPFFPISFLWPTAFNSI